MPEDPIRFIPMEGYSNFPDLGGYRASDGRTVKWRALSRSDGQHEMTPEYDREETFLREELDPLVVPGVDAAKEEGKLLEDLPQVREEATPSEHRKLLLTMLDAVYVDTIEEKSIVVIRPKPAFMPLFD